MDVPTTILDELKRDEGYKQFPYLDSRGIETIGYGFNLRDAGLPQDEAEHVLAMRLGKVVASVKRACPWVTILGEARQAVLFNQAYNLGMERFLAFHTYLDLVQAGRFPEAAADDMHTLWAIEVGDRAKRLCEQMRTGEWQ